METFETCVKINELLNEEQEPAARDLLITLLNDHLARSEAYGELVNSLIRQTGLYPYLQSQTASWQDRFAFEAFKVDTGEDYLPTLHREQSDVLRRLLDGHSIAVSAPTSFGKTFVIDAFLALVKPANVMIIVPTIALMDEMRRRLQRKFGVSYKVITTTDASLSERNLFIFPQERAIAYVDAIKSLDLLVVDEFYKASSDFDAERSPALLKAILKLSKRAKQRYFLAPNIGALTESVFTRGMEFVHKLDFNTVCLERHDLYRRINRDEEAKSRALVRILSENPRKTLVYAASYAEIAKVVELLTAELPVVQSPILKEFALWLAESYGTAWSLTGAVLHGVGIHNGQIHRALGQIQLRLFDLKDGLQTIVSTSSIIEGVNTSAEAVVLWKNRRGGRGNPYLDAFTYKNIIGRGGRMFRYFVGHIYLLEEPPSDEETQLDIEFPDSILGGLDEVEHSESLSGEQISKIVTFRERMTELVGAEAYKRLYAGSGVFQGSNSDLVLHIAEDMVADPGSWNGLAYLNSPNPAAWDRILYKLINLQPGGWDIQYAKFVRFVRVLSQNWNSGIPQLVRTLAPDVDVDLFFKLERNVTFKLSALLHDVNELQKELFGGRVDVSPFISKLSHAFLPSVVYQLEEYGLPRMLARKLHRAGVFNFEAQFEDMHAAISAFCRVSRPRIFEIPQLGSFDRYILEYFFEGIEPNASRRNEEVT